MRAGDWVTGPARGITTRMYGLDDPNLVSSCHIVASATGGDIFASSKSGGVAMTGDATLEPPRLVSTQIQTPFNRAADQSWPPPRGTYVTVEVDDGHGNEQVIFNGSIDSADGSLASAQTPVKLVDIVDRLSGQVRVDPVAWTMPGFQDGVAQTYPACTVEWMLDAAGRQLGWRGAPDASNPMLRCSMLGAATPTHGTMTSCQAIAGSDVGTSPIIDWTACVGDVRAIYQLSTHTTQPRARWKTMPQATGGTSVLRFQDASKGTGIRVVRSDNAIRVERWAGGSTFVVLGAQAASANTPGVVDIWVSRTVVRWRVDGGATQSATVALGSDWFCDVVDIYSTGPTGGFVVNNDTYGSVDRVLDETFLIRSAVATRMLAQPLIDRDFLDLLNESCTILGADAWLDRDGVLHWSGRGHLDRQPVSALTFDTELDWDAFEWSDNQANRRTGVNLTWKDTAISIKRRETAKAYEPTSAQTMEPGDTVEVWVTPDSDIAWLGMATGWVQPTGNIGDDAADLPGAWVGATVIQPDGGERMSSQAEVAVTIYPIDSQTQKLLITCRGLPPGARCELRVTKDFKRANQPLPLCHARGTVVWTERKAYNGFAGGVGPVEDIDAGWWLGSEQDRNTWLRDVALWGSDPDPTVNSIVVAYDPRAEIGDKVRLRDQALTGLNLHLVVLGIDADPNADQMTLSGRIVFSERTEPTRPQDPPEAA